MSGITLLAKMSVRGSLPPPVWTIFPSRRKDASGNSSVSRAVVRVVHGGGSRPPELSMGMSDNLEVVSRAGATMVRVGMAIFVPRAA